MTTLRCRAVVTGSRGTVPITKTISVKNARAWVSMVSYFKKKVKIFKKILRAV